MTLVLSVALHISAVATNGWVRVKQEMTGGQVVSRDVGLWEECHEDLGCRYFGVVEVNSELPIPHFMSTQNRLWTLNTTAK